MMHQIRHTEAKLARRLELIPQYIYRHTADIPPFRFHAREEALVQGDVDDQQWPMGQYRSPYASQHIVGLGPV